MFLYSFPNPIYITDISTTFFLPPVQVRSSQWQMIVSNGSSVQFIWAAEICLSDLRSNIANDITLPATHLEHVWELSLIQI